MLDVGATVTVISSSKEKVDAAVKRLASPNVKGLVANVRQEEAFIQTLRSLGTVDHIVYSAVDNIIRGKLEDLDIDAAKHLYGVKFWGSIIVGKGEWSTSSADCALTMRVSSCCKVRHYPQRRLTDLDIWNGGHQTWQRSRGRLGLERRLTLTDESPRWRPCREEDPCQYSGAWTGQDRVMGQAGENRGGAKGVV